LQGYGDTLDTVKEGEVAEGKWKYVQVSLKDQAGEEKLVVRSYKVIQPSENMRFNCRPSIIDISLLKGYKYHAEMYKVLMKKLSKKGLQGTVIGGGRIIRDSSKKVSYAMSKNKLNSEHDCIVIKLMFSPLPFTPSPLFQTISVYGYSKTFGRCAGCNEQSANILERAYPGFKIDWSDEGY